MSLITDNCLMAILLALILVLGSFGNLLSLIVFSRKRFRKISLNIMFRIMCLTDTLCLTQLLQTLLTYTGTYNIRTHSKFACHFFPYLAFSILPFKGWILVFIGFERYMTVKNPGKKLVIRKAKIQVIIIIIICAFNFIWYIPFMTNLSIYSMKGELICQQPKNFKKRITDSMDILNSCILPFSLMIMFTVLIVIEIYRSKNRIGNQLTNLCIIKKQQKCLKFTITSVSTNLVFIILNLPFRVNSFLIMVYYNKMLLDVFRAICYASFAMPIVIYILTNSLFRKELRVMTSFLKPKNTTNNQITTCHNLNKKKTSTGCGSM